MPFSAQEIAQSPADRERAQNRARGSAGHPSIREEAEGEGAHGRRKLPAGPEATPGLRSHGDRQGARGRKPWPRAEETEDRQAPTGPRLLLLGGRRLLTMRPGDRAVTRLLTRDGSDVARYAVSDVPAYRCLLTLYLKFYFKEEFQAQDEGIFLFLKHLRLAVEALSTGVKPGSPGIAGSVTQGWRSLAHPLPKGKASGSLRLRG